MTDYLLDTSIVSILEPRRGLLTAEMDAWLTAREPRLYLSAVTVFEGAQGIERLMLEGKHQRAMAIREWLDGLVSGVGERIFPLDLEIAKAAGRLSAQASRRGNHPGVADIMIAATAQVHDLLLLTRNLKHFADLDIEIADPTTDLPR